MSWLSQCVKFYYPPASGEEHFLCLYYFLTSEFKHTGGGRQQLLLYFNSEILDPGPTKCTSSLDTVHKTLVHPP